jgi:predicted transcriptional regulator
MNARELIEHFTPSSGGVNPLPVVRILRDETLSQAELANRFDVSRSTVGRIIGGLDETFVKETTDGYQLTGGGAAAVRTYADARKAIDIRETVETRGTIEVHESVDAEMLTCLVNSSAKRECFRLLREQQHSRGVLVTKPNMPSRSTVDRIVSTFEANGYVTRTKNGTYALTKAGQTAIDTYDRLIEGVDQIFRKSVSLKHLGVAIDTLPAANLADARVVETVPGRAYATRDAFLEYVNDIDSRSIDHIRIFVSFSNPSYEQMFMPFIQCGTQLDLVSPVDLARSHPSTTPEEIASTKAVIKADTTSWMLYEGTLPCSLVVFDDTKTVIGPAKPFATTGAYGTIFSTDPVIGQWAIDLFDRYHSETTILGEDMFSDDE